ncbi:MAG: M28 family metallopeptidase [Bacteroidetes bacterium]|jgi:hypothetical protein|nr:M28 family metallopeptidase [Bacteroidota bacterium]
MDRRQTHLRTTAVALLALAASALAAGQTPWSTPDGMHRVVRELSAQPTEGRVAYVRDALRKLGVAFREQSFDTVLVGDRDTLLLRGTNLIVRLGSGSAITVVGGHLDAVPTSPGANDNAAGVAVMLALISEWRTPPVPGIVEFAFFDREENGLIGSEVYVQSVTRAAHRAMLNLDVVGMGNEMFIGPVGGGDDDRMLPALRKAADSLRIPATFGETYPDSDHESFARRGLENLSISLMPAGDAAKLIRLLKEGWSGKLEDMPRALTTMHSPSDTADLVDPASLALALKFVRTSVVLLNAP